MNKYLYWSEELEIRKFPDNTMVLVKKTKSDGNMPKKENIQTLTINETAAEIIQLIDGTKSYNDIVSHLMTKYNEKHESIQEKVGMFLHNMVNSYNLNISSQNSNKKMPVHILNQSTIYPSVASIELTNKCNVRCLHCYGDFGNIKHSVMSLEQAKNLLNDFKGLGVRIVELTGGEMTVHPNIKEILLHAIDLKFDQISLLTNGIALTSKLKDIIIKNKSRIFMQIDIHSLDDDYLTWFFKVPNTLEVIKRNIVDLAENGVQMRTATIITRKNVHEIEKIADWVHSLDIKHFGVSPVVELGRAADRDLFLTKEDAIILEEKLERIHDKYENFLSIIEGDRSQHKNCGAIASHCVVSSNGDIKICTMDSLDFNSSIGNVLEKNVKDIYDENADYINSFFNMHSPKIDSVECADCINKHFCSACILRGLVKAKELGNRCNWYSKIVPTLVKEKLKLEQSSKILS
ncbi:radical SAM/SPASM domain-containing protein [Bacillus cereus]|nr:radical SAM/SPASM domain-containing protein [Bacillus cereus]